MYCPKCLNDSLRPNSRLVIKLSINGKQKDTGRFIVNAKDTDREKEIKLREKVEEFMKWYSTFLNKEPIEKVEIFSSDFSCSKGCAIGVEQSFSVINTIYPQEVIEKTFKRLAPKYGLTLNLKLS